MQITMTVNGTEYTRDVEPRLLLIHFLRDDLGLTGIHWGCDTSNCGACVVWLDDTPVKSCTVLAAMADGRAVRTVEGLEHDGELDPVQQGFAECHGLQCGFCTPGMLMTARWLLDHIPTRPPSRSGRPSPARSAAAPATRTSSGRSAGPRRSPGEQRRERAEADDDRADASSEGPAPAGLRADAAQGGRPVHPRPGHFVDDIQLPGMLHGAILRSPLRPRPDRLHRHRGRRGPPEGQGGHHRRDAGRARGLAWMPTLSEDVQAVLATDKVRFQGQEVAFVVAEDRYSARDALELIDVEYEPLPAVIDAKQGARPGRPGHPGRPGRARPDNHIFDWEAGDGGDRRGLRRAPTSSSPQDMLYPRVHPGAAGDLRHGRRHGQGHRQADRLVHDPGPARAPHRCTPWSPGCPSTRSGSSRPTSAAGSATRSPSTPGTSAPSSARSSPASR